MFARFTPFESRDVPATWHVQMLSSNPGSTDATITESLVVGTAIVYIQPDLHIGHIGIEPEMLPC